METVLYELHFRWADLPILLIPLLVGVGFWCVSCRVGRRRQSSSALPLGRGLSDSPVKRDLSASPAVKWLLRGVAILCGLVFVWAGAVHLSDYATLRACYDSGDYLTAEGYVEELTTAQYPDKGGDSFTVDGVTFAYSDTDLTLHGYRREARHGGVITREGQYLVIRYIPDPYTDTNHILYIAEREVPPS